MLNKEYSKLSAKEFYQLNKIVKRKNNGENLTAEEEKIYTKFNKDIEVERKKINSKQPLYLIGFIVILLAIIFELM